MKNSKEKAPIRDRMTDDELENVRASDLSRLKLDDDEKSRLREINRRLDDERLLRSARLAVEAAPLIAELKEAGMNVRSVWDLVNTAESYANAVPVLLKHLQMPYSDRTREGIARALAVRDPQVRNAWPLLVEEYRKAKSGLGFKAPGDDKMYELGAKDGLACTLSAAFSKDRLPEYIELLRDRSNGPSRLLLLSALRRSKDPVVLRLLEDLASDPDLTEELLSWGRFRTH
ncbi:hypothetical protein [Pseudoduganella aquatica]|uniref:Uncharacterized protein n=1 Tax=Pseudoduganella aquatica TaxID=2660641 RepID=A0A7X4H7Q0_9BURK|nr:hypothetical protein [Pseudoduganella aquatica]MYN06240.1 hypothetical protein [Pseudoduganella aquatica]